MNRLYIHGDPADEHTPDGGDPVVVTGGSCWRHNPRGAWSGQLPPIAITPGVSVGCIFVCAGSDAPEALKKESPLLGALLLSFVEFMKHLLSNISLAVFYDHTLV